MNMYFTLFKLQNYMFFLGRKNIKRRINNNFLLMFLMKIKTKLGETNTRWMLSCDISSTNKHIPMKKQLKNEYARIKYQKTP